MTDALLRLLRTVLAIALLGLGPATRLADALVYHSTSAPVLASHQADDGRSALPHGDGCLLAVASAPATPLMGCSHVLALAPTTFSQEAPRPDRPVVLRITGPPATRAPPA